MKRLVLTFVLLWPVGLLADYQAGLDAYERKDYATAYREWWPLAEQGLASAQSNLGLMYDNGYGVTEDDAEAAKWYRLAAEQGDARAQFNLGLMYKNGDGVPQDYAEAAKWYRLAAEQGDDDAQGFLAWMYHKGEGVPKDYAEAAKWYRLAAEQGNAEAQFYLGLMYSHGEGVLQDDERAYAWFNLAAAQGDENASRNRTIVRDRMTRAQVSRAQQLSGKLSQQIESRKQADTTGPAEREKQPQLAGSGSGFFVNTKGYALTNYHVIEDCNIVTVSVNGKRQQANVKATDSANDLALLNLSGTTSNKARRFTVPVECWK